MASGSIKRRLLSDGSLRWDVTVDLGTDGLSGGRRQRKKTFRTKREAEAGRRAWLVEIEKGLAVDRSKQTVAEMMAYWRDTYARQHVRPSSLEMYDLIINKHIVPALGPIPVQKLTPAHLEAFYSDKLAAGCGARTVQLCHLRLSQALDQAMRLGLVARNVTDLVSPPRVQTREMTTWDADQARAFLAVADQSAHGPLWLLALTTGMRRGELLGLRWEDFDAERRVLHVRQTVGVLHGAPEIRPPKSKSSRREVPIPDEVVRALREHKRYQNGRRLELGAMWRDNGLIFSTGLGTPINPNNLSRDFTRIVKLAGVPLIRIHDLRHSHVSLAIQRGANIKAVSKRVGHARTSITMDIYAHVMPEQHREVADIVGSALFGEAVSALS